MIEIIVALIGLCGIVVVTVITNVFSNKSLEKKVDGIAKHEEENYLGLLRLTIMSEEMPVSERIIAGKKYINAGGNGDVKKAYNALLQEHTR